MTVDPTAVTASPGSPGGVSRDSHGYSAKRIWTTRIAVPVLVAGCVGIMFLDAPSEVVGVGGIGLLIVLMFIKVPVAAALSVSGLLGLYALRGERAVANVMASIPYDAVASWTLSVLPMFVLMGLLLWRSGISNKIYVAARHWLGWLPGGLAIGTNAAGAGMAAVSGSTLGTTYALARIGIPEMLNAGYHRRLAVGSIVVAGLGGQLIPPSIMLVIYAGIAEVPVGPQLIAGIGPGLLLAACFGITILALCLARPAISGRGSGAAAIVSSWTERLLSAARIWPVPVLITVVLGSMFAGVLTATEAGAAGAFGAVLLALWYKRADKPIGAVRAAATDTVRVIGAILFIIVGAYIFARLLAVSGVAAGFSDWVADVGLGRVEFLLLMMVAYLVMGMFMDPLSMMLLTVPLLIPTLETLDISLLWFGVFAVLMAELAVITPPVGILAFIIHSITADPEVNLGQRITLGDVFRAIGWFLPVAIAFILILIAYPDIATTLPDLMMDG
ncbi:TRAP transporter large permease [Haloechinothrix sp. LS1_15]|uniref:TRAP transporter large permease n=1 Tax=Haloechinothrix sp. LS1_15 TaxID=2652248 RepID=UPI002946AA4E|nr:TRAP transporter large permease [Haloechinothrix sp. LS1_15]MDV6013502.1 TRAP transporter large permease [Haloechinothrix sp. LS1_15]